MGTFFYFSGLDEVLERLAHFKSSDWVLVLVGGGEERLNLERLVEDLELAPKVKFTGFVDFDSLSSYLKIADVAINPMRILAVSNYALPNKVLQYLASGVPVVSTRLAGLRSLVGEPCVSFAESPANVADLALEVLEQSDKSSQLNIESAVAQFDQVLAAREFETYLIRVAS
jgi:glycosyltransferase involved in cell wall biosynthesis